MDKLLISPLTEWRAQITHIEQMGMSSADDVFDEITAAGRSLPKKVANLLSEVLRGAQSENPLTTLPQQHPLGFLCLRWNLDAVRSVRIHIWDRGFDWTQHPNWPIHNHIFSFKSAVLVGSIQNKTYEPVQHSNRRAWEIYEVGYSKQCSVLTQQAHAVALKVSSSTLQPAGTSYELPAGILHRSTLRSDIAITALATTIDPVAALRPRVVGVSTRGNLSFDRFTDETRNINQIIQGTISLLIKQSKNFG
jgi:hypothetical protein